MTDMPMAREFADSDTTVDFDPPELHPPKSHAFAEPARDQRAAHLKTSVASVLPVAAILAACGGGGGGGGSTPTPPPPVIVPVRKPGTDAEAARFALQSGIAIKDADISALKTDGYAAWLNAQIDAPIAQTGVAWLASRGYDQITADNFFDNEYPADYMIWQQLMVPANGVRKRIALALSEFFVVSTFGVELQWRSQAMAHYWDQLNRNAFGNFRTLLEDITLNAAMGIYLSTRGNRKEDTRSGRVPDENYAREVMQLFTIGLYQLNPDGTNKLDANNKPIETYTNTDVSNLARVFTGYDYDFTGNVRRPSTNDANRQINSVTYTTLPMTADNSKWEFPRTTSEHSPLEKIFLGTTIPANTDAPTSLKTALDALFNHANTGPFFARQMIQRLITSNPSAGYVSRISAVFNNDGSGVRGNLRAVFRAILLDEEALGAPGLTNATFGKVREPMLRLAQWAQSFGATSASGSWKLGNLGDPARQIGQSPLRSPSVFNFFRPGYVPANTAIATNNLVAPEFQGINEISTPGYVNFMTYAISSGDGIYSDVKAQYASELAIAADADALMNRLCLVLAADQISATTKATIRTAVDAVAVTATSTDAIKLRRIHTAILLIMASPDYLVQK